MLLEECAACGQQSSHPKPRVSLDVEAVDATAADEIIGLVQGFFLQVLRAVAVLRHHKDIILQNKDKMGEPGSLAEPDRYSPKCAHSKAQMHPYLLISSPLAGTEHNTQSAQVLERPGGLPLYRGRSGSI